MHLKSILLFPEKYPTREHYPFNVPVFEHTREIPLDSSVTFFVGENGTGKSTLLEAIAHKCGIHIWKAEERRRFNINPFAHTLYKYIDVEWINGHVPGAFFGSDTFHYFAQCVEEWAISDPGMLEYFGGKSLISQSHGQSIMSLFKARYELKGVYLMDEPETALSPRSQLELLKLLNRQGAKGHAQFIIATHSPIVLACPGAAIYSFDHIPLKRVGYEDTDYYRIYKKFMEDRTQYI